MRRIPIGGFMVVEQIVLQEIFLIYVIKCFYLGTVAILFAVGNTTHIFNFLKSFQIN